jgi:hypothetical protein
MQRFAPLHDTVENILRDLDLMHCSLSCGGVGVNYFQLSPCDGFRGAQPIVLN